MSKKKNQIIFESLDPSISPERINSLEKGEDQEPVGSYLVKSILNTLNKNEKITRLAFEEDPTLNNRFGGIYFDKVGALPDRVLKKIAVTDGLIAAVLQTRTSQCAPFGKRLENKYGIGLRIKPNNEKEFITIGFSVVSDATLCTE